MRISRVWVKRLLALAGGLVLLAALGVAFNRYRELPKAGQVTDEARQTNRVSFPPPAEDHFHGMDGGLNLGLDEMHGRNTWMVWSAGNDRLWDWLARESGGEFDLLKIAGSYDPDKDASLKPERRDALKARYPFRRQNRIETLGVVNEPCYEEAAGPDLRRFGLWLDQRQLDCQLDPYASEEKYSGVATGARGRNLPVSSVYGEAPGVIGLRLFANPDFQGDAVARWDPARYYTDPSYWGSRELVRPYRVGVTCAFCHAGFNPAKPPDDPSD